MKLSIVIPFYKELPLISRTVNSVLADATSADEVEIIICNDGPFTSQDIRARLSAAANHVTIVIANRHSKGPGGARNTGLDSSTGDCIGFLDADDFWLPGKISAQLAAIQKGASFVTTAYRFDTGQTVIQPPESLDNPIDVFLRRGIGTSTVMITRTLLADYRFKNIRFAQDIDYWYALAQSPHFRYSAVDTCLVEYNTGGSTKSKWIQLQYFYKVLRANDIPWQFQVRILINYGLSGIYNHYIRRLFS